MIASCSSGLRWVLTQILISHGTEKKRTPAYQHGRLTLQDAINNPVTSLAYLTPVMSLLLLVFSLGLEKPWNIRHEARFWTNFGTVMQLIGCMSAGGAVAFAMIITEFILITRTSAVTLSVAAILKEVVTIIISRHIFGDKLHEINIIGLVIAVTGVIIYNFLRFGSLHREHHDDVKPILRDTRPENVSMEEEIATPLYPVGCGISDEFIISSGMAPDWGSSVRGGKGNTPSPT